jgi:hypothetical protein
LYFCMFEKSQVKDNSLDCHNVFGIFFWIVKFDTNQKCFYMFKTLKPWKWLVLVFFQMFFFTKCAPFLLKIKEDFNIDDYKGKRIWTNDFF